MPVEKHDLVHELPDSKEAIHHLKANDDHFRNLFDQYHEAEHEIHRYETGAENTSDEHLEDLKKQRLHLKDKLFHIIHDYESSTSK